MSRRMGMVCAGAMLLALAGCSHLLPFGPPGPEQVAVGSVVQVSGRIQTALAEDGILVATNQEGGDFRMAGQTKSGKVFCLHLTRVNVPRQMKTRVVLGGDRDLDPEFWPLIVKALAPPVVAEEEP